MSCRGIIGIFIGMVLVNGVQAAEWSFEPSIQARTRYDDNLRITSTNEVKTTEFSLKPSADFSRKTERTDITGTANLEFRKFDEDGLDTNDSEFNLALSHLLTERTRLGFNANWDNDTTLDSELDETGINFDRIERTNTVISPSILHSFNARWSAQASISLRNVKYDTSIAGYRDYDYDSASGQLFWQYTPKTKYTGGMDVARYKTNDGDYQQDNKQLSFGVEHKFSERLTASFSAGVRRTKATAPQFSPDCSGFEGTILIEPTPGNYLCAQPFGGFLIPVAVADIRQTALSETNNGQVYSGSIEHELERGSLNLSFSKSLTPSATSGLIDTTKLSLGWQHRFTEKLSSNLKLTWYDSKNTGDSISNVDRRYVEFSPHLYWSLAQDWIFQANYRYRKQDREGALGSATSNAVSFALNYSWPKVAVSR